MKIYRGSGLSARNYLDADRSPADDYYLTEGTGVARRYRVGADLAVDEIGALTGDAYEAWVNGLDPVTGEPRGRLRADDNAVRFVEVVVNGPKSWSLSAELHPDLAAAYEAAQDRAASQIIGWLGKHATTRVGPRGAQVATPVDYLEAVTVRHYTSRAGDPHRHLHLQVNTRVHAAGAWRGLDTMAVRDMIGAINGIGHAAVMCDPGFRQALARHGFTLDESGEIKQLAPYVQVFSQRTAQIEANLDRLEVAWRADHPGEEPGPYLRRSWDALAWEQHRPDKLRQVYGAHLHEQWLDQLISHGYQPPERAAAVPRTLVAEFDRDATAALALTRLASRRSAWNPADARGEVEQLLAAHIGELDHAVRMEMAEDVTARAVAASLPLLNRPTPEHIRSLTSNAVVAVEDDLVGRIAVRGALRGTDHTLDAAEDVASLDAGQRAAVAAIAGTHPLVMVEGAAGAGKTTTLTVARRVLERSGHRLVVVTPTLRAASAASSETGAAASSAAKLA